MAMAKKPKDIRPFFKLRFEINDTLEALSHEILVCLQAMETVIELGGLNEPSKKILQDRIDGIKKVCMSEDSE
jgi:hypothetical protein